MTTHLPLVAVGASAGGPRAMAAVLSALPDPLPAAVVLVQHLDAKFAPAMAEWLTQQAARPIALAREGDAPMRDVILLADAQGDLALTSAGRLHYVSSAGACAPSIDMFFASLIENWRGPVFAVLLTGMGRDGAAGLHALRIAGRHTIAQDAATCTVYGMPKAAAELGAASEILPLQNIGPRLVQLIDIERSAA